MSRSAWSETREPEPSRAGGGTSGSSDTRRVDRPRLVRGQNGRAPNARQPVHMRGRVYRIRHSEWHTLRTVGTFRVVAESDLVRDAGDQKTVRNDLLHLVEEGLLDRKTGMVNHHPTRLITLTSDGKALVDSHRDVTGWGRRQQYHAGLVKPKELAHDVQLYRAYRAEAARIEGDPRARDPCGARLRTQAGLPAVSEPARPAFRCHVRGRPARVCRRTAVAGGGRSPRTPGSAPGVRDRRRTD